MIIIVINVNIIYYVMLLQTVKKTNYNNIIGISHILCYQRVTGPYATFSWNSIISALEDAGFGFDTSSYNCACLSCRWSSKFSALFDFIILWLIKSITAITAVMVTTKVTENVIPTASDILMVSSVPSKFEW